jgi:hypothetical protein
MTQLTLAINERALEQIFGSFIEVFRFSTNSSTSGNPRFAIDVAAHFERGDFALVPPDPHSPIFTGGFFSLTDVVIKWDKLDFTATVHIPPVTLGNFCLIPNPLGGCILHIPGVTFFDFDLSATIAIDNIVDSRVDIAIAPQVDRYWNSDDNTYKWRVTPHDVWQQVQLIDVADTIGDLIDDLISEFVDSLLSFLPDWARAIIDAVLHGVANFIRALLSLPADLVDWLSNLLRVSLDPFDLIFQLLADYFQKKLSLYELDDPITLLSTETQPVPLPAVTAPVTDLVTCVQADEFVIGVSI